MYFYSSLIAILILTVKCIDQDYVDFHPEIDELLFELDNIVDEDFEFIPEELLFQCQMALGFWSIDGREDIDVPPSTPEHHALADRLLEKIRQIRLTLGGNELDRAGFIRDLFTLEGQWTISAIQYSTFIDHYDDPTNPSEMEKFIEWIAFKKDFNGGFPLMYHLERAYTDESGYIYMLGRSINPHHHEIIINFDDYCPSYMELKSWIIGDITGEATLDALISSEVLN